MAADGPVARQRANEARPEVVALGIDPGPAPGQRGPRVVAFGIDHPQPGRLLVSVKLRLDLLGQRQQPPRMAPFQHLLLAALPQALPGVLSDGLEHAIASALASLGRSQERLVEQGRDEVEDVGGIRPGDGTHCLGRFERPTTTEDGESSQQLALRLGEERVAPVDGCPQRLLSWHVGPIAAGEQLQTVIQADGDLGRAEHRQARR